MRFMDSVNSTFGIAVGTATCYGVGYLYGAIFRLDKTLAARAFAISIAVSLIFKASVNLATGGKEENAKQYYFYHLVGGTVLTAIQILAFRQLNLIANLGTAFLALNATMLALKNLNGYYHKS